jgi:YidC/Oxa1 family membrane protein insertase
MMILMMAGWMYFLPKMTQPKPKPKPAAVMLQDAAKLASKAGEDKKQLKQALGAYNKVAGTYKGTEEAGEAKMEAAGIYARLNDAMKSASTYESVIREFGPKNRELAEVAQQRLDKMRTDFDKKNSSHALYKFFDFFVALTGRNANFSYVLALILVTIIFKFAVTPLTHAQFKSMKEMQKIQPLVKELQEKYKGDQKTIGEKTMALYKEHGVNPFSGCLPILVQLPVLYMLYWMVRLYQFQFAGANFLWIGSSLAQKFPGIIGANLAERDIPLLAIYTVSMVVSQKMSIVDPAQAQQQKMMAYTMPVMFAFIFASFPSAFMLYWLVFNVLSTTQQYFIMRKPLPATVAAGNGSSGPAAEPPVKLTEELQKATAKSKTARRRRKK